MMNLDDRLCDASQAISNAYADTHTREVFALEAAILIQDLIDGKINHMEFLLCSGVDDSVNKV